MQGILYCLVGIPVFFHNQIESIVYVGLAFESRCTASMPKMSDAT